MEYSYAFKGKTKFADNLLEVAKDANNGNGILGLAHITGGCGPSIPISLKKVTINTNQQSIDIILPEGIPIEELAHIAAVVAPIAEHIDTITGYDS